jgi:hypothetical protein
MSLAITVISCNDGSKSKSWSKQQEKERETACVKMLKEGGIETLIAEEHCDCVFEKTSEK